MPLIFWYYSLYGKQAWAFETMMNEYTLGVLGVSLCCLVLKTKIELLTQISSMLRGLLMWGIVTVLRLLWKRKVLIGPGSQNTHKPRASAGQASDDTYTEVFLKTARSLHVSSEGRRAQISWCYKDYKIQEIWCCSFMISRKSPDYPAPQKKDDARR